MAHSFAITLQYALWDFFREMGESQVAGQERLAASEEVDSQGTVDAKRAQNIARAYGWWLGKGNLSLTILKVCQLLPMPLDNANVPTKATTIHFAPIAIPSLLETFVHNPLPLDPNFLADAKQQTTSTKQRSRRTSLPQGSSFP